MYGAKKAPIKPFNLIKLNTNEKTNPSPIVLITVGYDSVQYRGYIQKHILQDILIKHVKRRIIISIINNIKYLYCKNYNQNLDQLNHI